jgi:hypothetical protein
MPGDDDDLNAMTLDQLRAWRDEILSNIEAEGSQSADINPHSSEDIGKLDELLEDIEARIADLEQEAPDAPQA